MEHLRNHKRPQVSENPQQPGAPQQQQQQPQRSHEGQAEPGSSHDQGSQLDCGRPDSQNGASDQVADSIHKYSTQRPAEVRLDRVLLQPLLQSNLPLSARPTVLPWNTASRMLLVRLRHANTESLLDHLPCYLSSFSQCSGGWRSSYVMLTDGGATHG